MNKFLKKVLVGAGLAVSSFGAFAAAPTTMAELIAQVNFLDVLTALFTIGSLVIAVDLAQIGYLKVRRHVKGAAH